MKCISCQKRIIAPEINSECMSVREAHIEDVPILVEWWKEFVRDHEEIALRENPTHKPFLQMKENAADMAKDYMEKQVQSNDAFALLVEVKGSP